jgi:hypothetical protein
MKNRSCIVSRDPRRSSGYMNASVKSRAAEGDPQSVLRERVARAIAAGQRARIKKEKAALAEDGGFDVLKGTKGIEPHLVPFINAVQWRREQDLPPLAEHSFPYAEVEGQRVYLTNLVVALRQAFALGRPTAGGRA